MILFSRSNYNRGTEDNRGNRGNWNIGKNVGRKRGRNKRLRFSIQFDVDYEEFNQILQTGFLNLTGQGHFHPPQPPVKPPLQPHPNIVGIPIQSHVSMQPEHQDNDDWKNVVNSPPYFNDWPIISLLLPPPLHLE
jgi:hypothetical protein